MKKLLPSLLAMSIEPSPKLPETASGESAKKTPLKPGKGYGIASLICLVMSVLFMFLTETFESSIFNSTWYNISFAMETISMLCLAAALIFGILGRKTEGWIYANITLAIFLLCGLLFLVRGIVAIIWFGILGHST